MANPTKHIYRNRMVICLFKYVHTLVVVLCIAPYVSASAISPVSPHTGPDNEPGSGRPAPAAQQPVCLVQPRANLEPPWPASPVQPSQRVPLARDLSASTNNRPLGLEFLQQFLFLPLLAFKIQTRQQQTLQQFLRLDDGHDFAQVDNQNNKMNI